VIPILRGLNGGRIWGNELPSGAWFSLWRGYLLSGGFSDSELLFLLVVFGGWNDGRRLDRVSRKDEFLGFEYRYPTNLN